MAYEQLEPFAETRAEMRNALLCSTLASLKTQKSVPLRHFLIEYDSIWKETPRHNLLATKRRIARSFVGIKTGFINCYEGEAPAIKRIGKRGRSTPAKRRLQEILYGKPR